MKKILFYPYTKIGRKLGQKYNQETFKFEQDSHSLCKLNQPRIKGHKNN